MSNIACKEWVSSLLHKCLNKNASATEYGSVKIGDTITVADDGTISVPYATKDDYGIVKIGDGLSVSGDTVSVDWQDKLTTDETAVGTWFDGSTIYRRGFTFWANNAFGSGVTTKGTDRYGFPFSTTNIKKFIRCYGYGTSTSDYTWNYPINSSATTSYYMVFIPSAYNQYFYWKCLGPTTWSEIYVVVEYIKN